MCTEEDCIDKRLSEAQKAHPTVTDAAVTRTRDLLKRQLGEAQLTPKKLTDTARALIADMDTLAAPKTGAGHED